MSLENVIKVTVSALALVASLWLAVTSSIAGQVLGVTLLALVLWSLYPKRHFLSSIIIIILLAFFEASLNLQEFLNTLLSAYGRGGIWIIISGFILAGAMKASGLARRLAFSIVSSLNGRPDVIVLSVALASLAIAPLSPSTTAKALLLLPVCNALAEAFGGEKGGSRYGAGLMLMAMAANNICSTGFLTATVPNPISAIYIRDATDMNLSWFDWLKMNLPLSLILLFVSWVVCRRIFAPEVKGNQEALNKIRHLRNTLGPVSHKEQLVAIVFLAALLLWITERFNPFNAGLLSVLLSLVLFLPGVGVLGIRGFTREVPWGSIGLFAASMFLARAVSHWKALDSVTRVIFNILRLERLSHPAFLFLAILVFMLLHVAFTSTTVYATVMIPLAMNLAKLHGLPPQLFAVPVAFLTPIAIILPVNTIPNIVFYSSGWFNQRQMVLYGMFTSLLSVLLILGIGIPYWSFMRLLGS